MGKSDEERIAELEAELATLRAKAAEKPPAKKPAKKRAAKKATGRVTAKKPRTPSRGDVRLRVTSVRREEPDLQKIAQVVIDLASRKAQGWQREHDISGMDGDGTWPMAGRRVGRDAMAHTWQITNSGGNSLRDDGVTTALNFRGVWNCRTGKSPGQHSARASLLGRQAFYR